MRFIASVLALALAVFAILPAAQAALPIPSVGPLPVSACDRLPATDTLAWCVWSGSSGTCAGVLLGFYTGATSCTDARAPQQTVCYSGYAGGWYRECHSLVP